MAGNKKRAGQYPNSKVSASNFLPKTFQSDTNKAWLDSTFDQMISKGNLKNYHGYIGSTHGSERNLHDTYIDIINNNKAKQISQLQPGIVLKDNENKITNTLAFDDVVNALQTNFTNYNYASAYSSQGYVFNPPVNIDMLVNYSSYYWAQNLPIYTATNTGAAVDIFDAIDNQAVYELTDDNNTFKLHNGMIIKFEGSWGATATNNTYIVTGVGTGIKLILFRDTNGKTMYSNQYKGNIRSDGYWDRNVVYDVEFRTESKYAGQSSLDMISAYNADTAADKPVFFDGFNLLRHESNNDKLVNNLYANLPDQTGVYYLEVGVGTVTATAITPNSNLGESYDIESWDFEQVIETEPDYIVIAKDDSRQTAWSRINNWVHIDCLKTLKQIIPHIDLSLYANATYQAKRSIIEFETKMNLFEGADYIASTDMQWLGHIDYYVKPEGDFLPTVSGSDLIMPAEANIENGSLVIFTDTYDTHVYKMTGGVLVEHKAIVNGYTAFIDYTPFTDLKTYEKCDVYFTSAGIQKSQAKTLAHQEPLFKVYTVDNEEVSQFDNEFVGNKVFGYKQGTGHTDPILGKQLSYKDTPKGAEYEFENYLNTYTLDFVVGDDVDPKLGYEYVGKGYNYFKQDNKLSTLYKTSDNIFGAYEHLQYTITSAQITAQQFDIPVGYSNYRPTVEYFVYMVDGKINLKETTSQGTSINKNVDRFKDGILVDSTSTIKITNLTDDNLVFTNNSVTIASGATEELTSIVNDSAEYNSQSVFKITVADSINNQFYRLTKNGENFDSADVTVNATTTTINTTQCKEGDIIDFEFINNDLSNATNNPSFPTLWQSNSNNEMFDSFTISETADHWKDIMLAIPGFDGNVFGENNFSSSIRLSSYGGKIFLNENTGIMHDMQYINKEYSITGALFEQGQDYDAFITRFRNQVRRVYSSTTISNISEVVSKTLTTLLANKKGTDLYRTSNMLYTEEPVTNTFTIDDNQTTFTIDKIAGGDVNIRDHVYVWLTDDKDNNDTMVRRILVKDKEYTVNGDKINLLVTPQTSASGQYPSVEVNYYQMDNNSYVPQSLVKLGIQVGQQPKVVDNKLITHDNRTYPLASGADLFNMNTATFDVVNAAQYELECMIYAGIVKDDLLYSNVRLKSIDKYIPSQHRSTWYTNAEIDNYVYTYYSKWAKANNYPVVLEEIVYDAADSKTWNYKDMTSTILGSYNHFVDTNLPGHYVGIYNILFGTATPHITPWHMLGFNFKPQWWDTYYSWTDATKRTALIDALTFGKTNNPANTVTQEITYARHAWDWTNNSPVDTNGDLVDPKDILGTPSVIEASKPFVFGDWGPTEQLFRQTAQCNAVTIDAVIKLKPAQAFTEFFQPGSFISVVNDDSSFKVSGLENKMINSKSFILPGYKSNKVLNAIKIIANHTYSNTANESSVVYGNKFNQNFTPIVNFDSLGQVDNIIVNKRLFDIVDEAVFTSNILDDNLDLEYEYKQLEYVANGISQAQYNYTIRNRYTDLAEQNYANLDTQLIQKVNGFTTKSSMNFFAESGNEGSFAISDNDYEIVMHSGYPHTLINASQITIKKEPEGYQIKGASTNRQEFMFLEPNKNNFTDIEVSNRVIRKYSKFVTNHSVLEYGSVLNKIQDVYTFIRGYFAFLENNGFKFTTSKDAHANTFVRWTVRAEEDQEITLDLGKIIEFTSTHGHVSETGTFDYFGNTINFRDGSGVSKENLVVSRKENVITFENKQEKSFGNITVAVVDFEHAIVFNNNTIFNNVLFDDVKMSRQDRLIARGGVTKEWNGEKKAPGHLVFDDHIVQNFDSSVEETNEYYRTDVTEFNPDVRKAKNISIGNIDRDWVENLHLDPNVITKFYQGAIKEAGTNASVDRLARFIKGADDIEVFEKYMFNHSYFGDTTKKHSTEIKLLQNEIGNNPQVIEFSEQPSVTKSIAITNDDSRFVNKDSIEFNIAAFDQEKTKLNTAGSPLSTEARYYAFNTTAMPDVYDSTADYAKVESWSNTKTYSFGDIVRLDSVLYKCKVDTTGLTSVNEGIEVTGVKRFPVFPIGTQVKIDNNPVTLTQTNTILGDIVAQGSVSNPVVENLNQLTINGNVLTFTVDSSGTGVLGPAQLLGNFANPSLTTKSGKSIVINGTTVDFDDIPNNVTQNTAIQNVGVTPPNVVETFQHPADFTGTGTTKQVTIASSLTGYTVDTIQAVITFVDTTTTTQNIALSNLTGQVLDITQTLANWTNTTSVEVTITHTPVIDLLDTYTINETLSVTGYQLSSVVVDGSTLTSSDFTLSGQVVTLDNVSQYSEGDSIEFVLVHVDNGATTAEIISTITSAVPNVTATLDSNDHILLEFTGTIPGDQLVLSAGATNTELGFDPAGEIAVVQSGAIFPQLTMQQILDQINNFQLFQLDNITATQANNQLVLTKSEINNPLQSMTISAGATIFGFNTTPYPTNETTEQVEIGFLKAINDINNHFTSQGINDITASVVAGAQIRISSPRQSLDLGDTEFNTIAILPSGLQTNNVTSIQNIFNENEWQRLDDSDDPALFNIWVVNDSDYGVEGLGSLKTKFYSWNVFQVQNHTLFTKGQDDEPCGICAGTATSDGNDAQITTNSAHGLVAGDYVMLTNTTTQPNIDGIHKVTQVDAADNKVFFIDKFIDVCGNASSVMVLRPQRFETTTQRDLSTTVTNQSLVYVDKVDGISGPVTTNVFTASEDVSGNITYDLPPGTRFTKYRIVNDDVANITIYDYDKNKTVKQLELFDPLRGVIPGIANAEIDMTDDVDLASYNNTSDEEYTTVTENYWTQEQLGKRWWDTSKVVYYDYDQGDYTYQSSHWGKLFPGSSIDVYEWTKSTVSPEDYAGAVENQTEMFGVVASGEAYYVYDSLLQENYYYYSTVEEWNNTLGTYSTCYYFWVKNKNTVPSGKDLSTSAVADIIENPTANGISWFAALTPQTTSLTPTHTSGNAFILSNADIYLNDTSTVIQINRVPAGINHNSWTTIAKDRDLIPDYYYIGLRNNLATVDALDNSLPNYNAHPFNRYGDDRNNKQTWFVDHKSARLNAYTIINSLLKDINLYTDYYDIWNREFIKSSMPTRTWKWTNYVSKDRNLFVVPSITINNINELDSIDTDQITAVKLKITSEGLDRSEILEYIDGYWVVTEKANATIELEDIVAVKRAGWDVYSWDQTTWDRTETRDWWRTIIDACRNDWFIDSNIVKFNKLFFAMVDYTLSEQDQNNWCHKSTYVKLDITHSINTTLRKYTRSTMNNIIGYVDTLKPFHTKVDEILDIQETKEETTITITEDPKQTIYFDSDKNAVTNEYEFNDFTSVFSGDVRDGGSAWDAIAGITDSNDWSFTETYDNGAFHQPNLFTSENNPQRQHNLKVTIGTLTGFTVQTNTAANTVDNNTRTFVYLKNMYSDIPVIVALEESKSALTTTEIAVGGDTVTLDDASAFADTGIAYVNNEFIQYNKNGNDLTFITRSTMNSLALQHATGSVIVDVTNSFLTSAEIGTTMLNDMGESILTSTDSLAAVELQSLGKGITI